VFLYSLYTLLVVSPATLIMTDRQLFLKQYCLFVIV